VNDAGASCLRSPGRWKGKNPEYNSGLPAGNNILKGRTARLSCFLNVLAWFPLSERAQEKRLPWLNIETNRHCLGNEKLEKIRSRMFKTDFADPAMPTEFLLIQRLNIHPHQQMAFEYLMVDNLLPGRRTNFSERTQTTE